MAYGLGKEAGLRQDAPVCPTAGQTRKYQPGSSV